MQEQEINRNKVIMIIERFDSAVEHSIVHLQELTIENDNQECYTNKSNGKGFNRTDKKLGAYCASWIGKGKNLSGKFLYDCRSMLKKYWRQIGSDEKFQETFKCFPEEKLHIKDEVWSDPDL